MRSQRAVSRRVVSAALACGVLAVVTAKPARAMRPMDDREAARIIVTWTTVNGTLVSQPCPSPCCVCNEEAQCVYARAVGQDNWDCQPQTTTDQCAIYPHQVLCAYWRWYTQMDPVLKVCKGTFGDMHKYKAKSNDLGISAAGRVIGDPCL